MEKEEVKKIIEGVLKKTDFSFSDIEVVEDEQIKNVIYSIKTKEADLLIGSKGKTLNSFNHLIRKLVEEKNKGNETYNFIIDINDYYLKKIDYLKNKANLLAQRSRYFQSDIELEPMNAYERMIIHSFLAQTDDLQTESRGDGLQRRVVIKFSRK